MSVVYVDLVDYPAIAAELTGLDPATLQRVARIELAEPALHAPAAGFGETKFYPDFIDKSAVLLVRLAKNHPLPDLANHDPDAPGAGSRAPVELGDAMAEQLAQSAAHLGRVRAVAAVPHLPHPPPPHP